MDYIQELEQIDTDIGKLRTIHKVKLTDRQTDVVLCNDLQIIVRGEYNVNQEQKVPGFLYRNLSHYEYM